jgi:hypothetical protein
MSFREVWYPRALAALISLRGEGGVALTGERLPLTSAIDTLAILAQFPGPLAQSIERFQASQAEGFVAGGAPMADRALSASWLNADGTMRDFGVHEIMKGIDSVSLLEYLAGYPAFGAPWLRRPSTSTGFYSMWIPSDGGSEVHILSLYRAAVKQWSVAVQSSTDMLTDYGADITASMANWRNQEFWGAIRKLCNEMDNINANPPLPNAQKITEAVKVALDRAGDVAGQGAAHIAETVGRTAGSAAQGFLDTANITAVVVAGIAIFLMVR